MKLPVTLASLAIGLALAATAGAQGAPSAKAGASGQMAASAAKRERAGSGTRSHKTARPNRKASARTNAAGQTMSTNGPSYNAGGTNPDGSLPH